MKKRLSHRHLPERVYFKCGSYYFVDRKNKWTKIGKTLSEAMTQWVSIIEPTQDILTMRQLFDRYMFEIAPKKSPESYRINKSEIQNLYAAFGHMSPNSIDPVHVYQFLDARGKNAPVSANREKALLSHIFSMAMRWGIVKVNPCRGVKRLTEKKRDRYVTDDEYNSLYSIVPSHIQNLMKFAHLTGLRQADILKLKLHDLHDDGIYIQINKTKNKLLIEWSPKLRAVVSCARKIAEELHSEFLFPNQKGKAYTSSGFQSVWQKLMLKAVEKGIIQEKFRFHDLRRKTATDLERTGGRENARQLLGHADQKTTGIYISGVQRVKPLE